MDFGRAGGDSGGAFVDDVGAGVFAQARDGAGGDVGRVGVVGDVVIGHLAAVVSAECAVAGWETGVHDVLAGEPRGAEEDDAEAGFGVEVLELPLGGEVGWEFLRAPVDVVHLFAWRAHGHPAAGEGDLAGAFHLPALDACGRVHGARVEQAFAALVEVGFGGWECCGRGGREEELSAVDVGWHV